MSSPTYEGKGQPFPTTGWFSGLTAWWNALTPKYVTNRSGVSSATVASGVGKVLSGAAPTPSDQTGAVPAAGEPCSDTGSGTTTV